MLINNNDNLIFFLKCQLQIIILFISVQELGATSKATLVSCGISVLVSQNFSWLAAATLASDGIS